MAARVFRRLRTASSFCSDAKGTKKSPGADSPCQGEMSRRDRGGRDRGVWERPAADALVFHAPLSPGPPVYGGRGYSTGALMVAAGAGDLLKGVYLKGGQRPPPNHDPTKWSWFGEEEQGNGATDTRQGVRSEMDFATTTLPLFSMTWDRCFYLFTARLGGAAYIVGRGRAGGGGRALQKAHDRAGGQRPPLQNGNS